MLSFRATSTSTPSRHMLPETHRTPVAWHETLEAVAVVMVGLVAFAFVLFVLPWVISI